jgi:inner membrane protein
MSGDTHAAVGAASALAIASTAGSSFMLGSIEPMIVCTGVAAIGALFPDLDVKNSKGNKILNKVLWTLIPIAVVMLIAQYLGWVKFKGSVRSQEQLVAAVIFLGIAVWAKTRPHREATHSLVMMLVTTALVYVAFNNNYYMWYGIGYASHLFIDYFNTKGESIIWPAPGKFCLGLCTASGIVNKVLKYLGIAVTVLFLIMIGGRS